MIPLSDSTMEIRFLDGPGGDVIGTLKWNPNTGKVTGYMRTEVMSILREVAVRGYYNGYKGSFQVHNPFHDPHDFKAVLTTMEQDIVWPPELENIQIRWIEQPEPEEGDVY